MAKAIENIAFYCFNDHKECESWCKYSSNPDTYIHSVIGGAFTNENLFEDLKQLFNSFAQKSDQFAAGASSNVNVSLNAMIVSKEPVAARHLRLLLRTQTNSHTYIQN